MKVLHFSEREMYLLIEIYKLISIVIIWITSLTEDSILYIVVLVTLLPWNWFRLYFYILYVYKVINY